MKFLATGVALSLLSLALLATACGGSGSSSKSAFTIDSGKVPTATLPANLPDPVLVEGVPTRAVTPSGDTYTVQSGDSLYAIAEKLGTTVDELTALNDLTSNDLSVGQVLRIPGSASHTQGSPTPTGAQATSTPTARATEATEATPQATDTPEAANTPQAGQTVYTVQDGDNANDIALRFGVTLDELAAANSMTVDDLRNLEVGQVLIIPPPSTTPEPQATEGSPEETATPAPE